MEAHTCPFNCKVEFLSQLWVCTHQGCNLPIIRCKNCFVKTHNYIDELGKFKVHTNQKFDENQIFKNFLYFIKLYQIIQNKFKKSYGKINLNVQYYTYQIFCTSQFAKIFPSQQALSQFYTLKQIFNKRQANFSMSPSSDISNALSLFTEKLFNNARNQLLQPTEQQLLLSYYFNQTSDCNPQPLQSFIGQQQIYFTQFCDKTRQTNQNFEIQSYIKSRRQTHNLKKIYFSNIFENFLQQKYSQKPQQKQLFTSSQYINYVWQNFNVICSNPELESYLNQWIINFKTYDEYMKSQQLTPTLLAFRMWKNHVPNTGSIALHQDKYFLDTFIFAFIEYFIAIQNYSVGINVSTLNWKNFIKYLKDYVAVSKLKGEQFVDLSKYSDYYEFRTKNQKFIQLLQKSQQVTFNKDYCIQYLNQAYKENIKLSKKNYIKYLTTKQQQQKQKQIKLLQTSKQLHKQLQQEQGQRFYVIIYNDYIRTCLQQNTNVTKQGYYIFKKLVLQRYSQQQIKLNNDELLLAEKQAIQANYKAFKDKQQQEGQVKKQQGKILYEVTQNEQLLANLDSDKEEQQGDVCPCCEGKPQDCQKEQCQMVGFCATCSL